MTRTEPPRLAVALLNRFLAHDDPLAGDLLERYAATGSRLWLWRQVIMAILLRGFAPSDREHPLGLTESTGLPAEDRSVPLRPFRMNHLAASPVAGVGGLGLIALAVVLTLFVSNVWLLMLLGVTGGAAIAVAMTMARRGMGSSRPLSISHRPGD
jgi:hypothetical protein